jgi:vacuolar protein sorting-associated protein 41
MVDAPDDRGDTKSAKGKEPERDEGDTTVEEETVDESDAEEEDDDDDGEEDEPKLKYARLTGHLLPVYRNGDATSAFLVAGDKMVGLDEEVCLRSSAEPIHSLLAPTMAIS